MPTHPPLSVAVLFSSRGGNLQALARSASSGNLNIHIRGTICNRPSAAGIRHALHYALPLHIIDHRQYSDRAGFERDLMRALDASQVELVILAGFMRILSDTLVMRYAGRMINLHPSLLPKYRGLNTHQRALDAGDRIHGASVHLVVPELDNGPVIAQYRMAIQANDDAATLAERLAPHEHRLLQTVTELFAQRALQVKSDKVIHAGQPLPGPLQLDHDLAAVNTGCVTTTP